MGQRKTRPCKMNGKHRVKVQRPTSDSIHISREGVRMIPIKGRANKKDAQLDIVRTQGKN